MVIVDFCSHLGQACRSGAVIDFDDLSIFLPDFLWLERGVMSSACMFIIQVPVGTAVAIDASNGAVPLRALEHSNAISMC